MFTASHLRVPVRDRTVLAALLVMLVGTAWLVLWLWDASPYGRYLHHDTPTGLGTPLELGLFVIGWALMIVAMMLPTAIPLLATFGALVGRRRRPGLLVGLVIWLSFTLIGVEQAVVWGIAAFVLDFIPYIGALVLASGSSLVAFVQFGDIDMAILVGGVVLAIHTLSGNLLTPLSPATRLPVRAWENAAKAREKFFCRAAIKPSIKRARVQLPGRKVGPNAKAFKASGSPSSTQ